MSDSQSRIRLRAIVMLVLVNCLWGMSFPVMKCLNAQVDSFHGTDEVSASIGLRLASAAGIIALRFSVASLLFLFFFRSIVRQVGRTELWSGILVGILFVSGLVLQVIGLATISASRSGFLTSLAVVFTAILSSIFQRRRPTVQVISGVAVAALGVAILTEVVSVSRYGLSITQHLHSVWTLGDTLTMLGAMFFSVQIILVDHLGKRANSAAFTPSMFVTASVLGGLVWLASRSAVMETPQMSTVSLFLRPCFCGLILFLSVFCSLLAFSWMNRYQPYVTAIQAAVIYTLEPVFTSSWALVLPGILTTICGVGYANEELTVSLLIGGGLVLLANGLTLGGTLSDSAMKND